MSAEPAGRDPPPLLDWSDRSHWSHTARQCRYCPGLTNLRDSKGKAAHKVCAEEALAQQAAEAADAYQTGHLG
ncbi:hypothetical protein [Streptomyces sp. MB09-02B]|uniref:hypothetical protein n=1 Tax=Streptomyces sp. MB09-02B TaxID=3028667 RepID=UPI0029B45BC5|nr:hypothetical protein [Streptomyces sp. MB09-02B]MDX3639289.1 hypothetical protein [Streptomyces sp. MB09-02B]